MCKKNVSENLKVSFYQPLFPVPSRIFAKIAEICANISLAACFAKENTSHDRRRPRGQ